MTDSGQICHFSSAAARCFWEGQTPRSELGAKRPEAGGSALKCLGLAISPLASLSRGRPLREGDSVNFILDLINCESYGDVACVTLCSLQYQFSVIRIGSSLSMSDDDDNDLLGGEGRILLESRLRVGI